MLRRTHVALLLACGGCHADQPAPARSIAGAPVAAPSRPPATPPASAAPRAAEEARYVEPERVSPPAHPAGYLVWWADEAHAARTVWLDGGGRVLASRGGVYVAARRRLWRWTERRERMWGLDCECVRNGNPGECGSVASLTGTVYLTEVGGLGRITVLAPPDSADRAPAQQSAAALAGAGPYLMVGVEARAHYCGAHDLPAGGLDLMDLEHDRGVDVREPPGVAWRDSAAAVRAFAATAGDLEIDAEQPDDPGQLYGLEVQWLPDGTLQTGYRYGRSTCFICGDGGESYLRTVLVPNPVIPRWLAPWTRAPEPVLRYWRRPALRHGWAQVSRWAGDGDALRVNGWYGVAFRTGWSPVDSAGAARMLGLFRR